MDAVSLSSLSITTSSARIGVNTTVTNSTTMSMQSTLAQSTALLTPGNETVITSANTTTTTSSMNNSIATTNLMNSSSSSRNWTVMQLVNMTSSSHDLRNPDLNATTTLSVNSNPSATISEATNSSTVPSTSNKSSTTASTTTLQSTTTPTTTIPDNVIAVFPSCSPFNDTNAVPNSTDFSHGSVISVTCRPSFKLVTSPINPGIFICNGGNWWPFPPACRPGSSDSPPVGVIVGCTIGGFVCLVLVIIALFLLFRSIKDKKAQNQRDKEFTDKMDQIGLYVSSTFQDSVGMPVLTMDTRDSDLRGRVSLSSDDKSHTITTEPDSVDVGKLGADLF